MSFRVRNGAEINFGIMSAAVTVTHVRFRVASDDGEPVVVDVTDVAVGANEGLRILPNQLSVKYNSGDLTDAHMEEAIKSYWENVAFEIDAMTDSNTVVSDSGYSQQSNNNWNFDTPADT